MGSTFARGKLVGLGAVVGKVHVHLYVHFVFYMWGCTWVLWDANGNLALLISSVVLVVAVLFACTKIYEHKNRAC